MSKYGFSFKSCSHPPREVFVNRKQSITYYGADEEGVASFTGDCVINLTSVPGPKAGSTTYTIPELARHMIDLPDEIILVWPDFSTPPVEASFWKALDSYLDKKDYNSVCFRCKAGHGRTGTALSAMMIANLRFSAEQAIQEVRSNYCHHAVETSEQVLYLINLDVELNGAQLPDADSLEEMVYNLTPKLFSKNEFSNFR